MNIKLDLGSAARMSTAAVGGYLAANQFKEAVQKGLQINRFTCGLFSQCSYSDISDKISWALKMGLQQMQYNFEAVKSSPKEMLLTSAVLGVAALSAYGTESVYQAAKRVLFGSELPVEQQTIAAKRSPEELERAERSLQQAVIEELKAKQQGQNQTTLIDKVVAGTLIPERQKTERFAQGLADALTKQTPLIDKVVAGILIPERQKTERFAQGLADALTKQNLAQ